MTALFVVKSPYTCVGSYENLVSLIAPYLCELAVSLAYHEVDFQL
jgi:hypothetical protein